MLAHRRRRIETPSPPAGTSIYDHTEDPATASPTPVRRKKTSITAQTNVCATTVTRKKTFITAQTNVDATTATLGFNTRNMIQLPGYRGPVAWAADTHRARARCSTHVARKAAGLWATVQLVLTE